MSGEEVLHVCRWRDFSRELKQLETAERRWRFRADTCLEHTGWNFRFCSVTVTVAQFSLSLSVKYMRNIRLVCLAIRPFDNDTHNLFWIAYMYRCECYWIPNWRKVFEFARTRKMVGFRSDTLLEAFLVPWKLACGGIFQLEDFISSSVHCWTY